MKNFSSKGIRFSGKSIKCCIGFIDLVDSTKNTITMDNLEAIRKYYSTFINSISENVKSYSGKVIKNIGDCLLFYFPKTSNNKNSDAFKEAIDCGFNILDKRYNINEELTTQHLPPFNYKIIIDYGLVDLALMGEHSQIDLFGSTINLCSKINSSSLSIPNEIIIGDNVYRVLKSFPSLSKNFNFFNNSEYKITHVIRYPTYNIKKEHIFSPPEKQIGSAINDLNESKNENGLFFNKENNNKRVIVVDDEQEILFTYRAFLQDYNYEVTSFTDPSIALNYIRDHSNFNNLLVILDIRMKNFNGFQLYQQIKAIDPTIKILFITALDIIDEILSIVPGLSKEQIMRKPVDKKVFTNTVKKLLNK
ncbi:MAG TPA: response regulator [Nitrososphaeraceae archaeon]|nr:response regulator [Nitrososphaeraceae archaeon]